MGQSTMSAPFTGPSSVTFDWRGSETAIHYGPTSSYGHDVNAVPPDPLPFSSPGPFWEARPWANETGKARSIRTKQNVNAFRC